MKHHLVLFLSSLVGRGAEKVILTLAEQFVSRGVQCDLVTATTCDELTKRVPYGVRLINMQMNKTRSAIFKFISYIRQEHPDAILSSGLRANVTAIIAGRIAHCSTRIVIREANRTDMDIYSQSRARSWLDHVIALQTYPHADAAIAVSNSVREGLISMRLSMGAKITVIPNPVRTYHGAASPLSKQEPPLILACGRLTKQKDHATLLRAFASLRQRGVEARLVVLGSGDLLPKLRNQAHTLGIEGDVMFPGHVDDPQAWMRAASVFVHTSTFEGLPNVLLEALDAGCPVVATDCPGGVREVLVDGRFGTLVPVGDYFATAGAIEEILARQVQFPNAREYLKRFDAGRVAAEYLAVLFPQDAEPVT